MRNKPNLADKREGILAEENRVVGRTVLNPHEGEVSISGSVTERLGTAESFLFP